MNKMLSVDLFCGAGGTTEGAEMSGEVRTIFAANHWDIAIQTHSRNFPHAKHAKARIDEVHPSEVGKFHILFASPPCPGHSVARGSRPTSDAERADPWDVMKWFEFHRMPEAVIENVPGFVNWGPVGDDGRPLKKFKGRFFESWIQAIKSAGYSVEWRILNCCNYGAMTSRPRLIIRARKGNRSPAWPDETHGPENWRTAREAIDLSVAGRPIQGRIADSTLNRISVGREKFGERFIVEYYGSSTAVSLDQPLPTITTRDRHGLVIGDTLRMLSNQELAKAQGFRLEYYFAGSRTDITRQIGNSVPPDLSRAICQAIAS